MSNLSFSLETEVDYFSKVLVVDEMGEFSTVLVDLLLGQGCSIFYFGREKEKSFYYLNEKNNFKFLNDSSEIETLKKIDYLFFLPAENATSEIADGGIVKTEDLLRLSQKHHAKVLICLPLNNPEKEKYRDLVKEAGLNARLVVFDQLFGPRITTGSLGKLFLAGQKRKEAILPEDSEGEIFPVEARVMAGELVKLIFSADTRGKAYFLMPEKMSWGELVERLKRDCPGLTVKFLGSSQKEGNNEGFRQVSVVQNWEEVTTETVDWFNRNTPTEEVENESVVAESAPTEKEEEPLTVEEKEDFSSLMSSIQNLSPKGVSPLVEELKEEERKEKKLDFLATRKVDKPISPLPKRKIPRQVRAGGAIFLLLFLSLFLGPLLLSILFGLAGISALEQLRKEIDQGNFSQAVTKSARAEEMFRLSQKAISIASPFYGLVGLEGRIEPINEVLNFSQNINDSLRFSLLASQEIVGLSEGFLSEESVNWSEALSSAKSSLSFAYERASLAQTSLTTVEPGFNFLGQGTAYEKLKKYLPEAREILLKSQSLVAVLPKVLAVSGRRTYLILFQNNTELRPTGGFIGSYGMVNLENGKLVDFEVFDVYQADGQLKGHVEPPPKLKQYLGEANWYLRDSNWDPDFTVSAQRVQWFLDKEMQAATDGVVAVNLETVRSLLSVLGEVEVPEYNEKVNQDNLFQKAEYYSEVGTFPGSTQKKDFLASLAQALFDKIRKAKDKDLVNLGGALFSSLERKETLLYFNDPETQSVISKLNWDGNIREYQPTHDTISVFADYLFLNEANVGVNKANFFVKRKIDHQINLTKDGKVEEKLTLTYDNQSPSDNWPAGRYKTYLRLYLPKSAKVTSILATDAVNPSLWLPFDLKFFDVAEEHGKSQFGFLFEVPIKATRTLEIKYELPESFDFNKKISAYLFMLQKQSGAYPSDYTLTFTYPDNFVPVRVIPSAIVGNRQLLVTGKLDRDLIYQIDLAH